MDTNTVHPTGPTSCTVKFDWWVEEPHAEDTDFIDKSIAASDKVQQEDIALCESVQHGLQSSGFRPGRYAPQLEAPMFHFHKQLQQRYGAVRDASMSTADGGLAATGRFTRA